MTSASYTTQNRIDKKETTLHLRGKFVKYLYQSQYKHYLIPYLLFIWFMFFAFIGNIFLLHQKSCCYAAFMRIFSDCACVDPFRIGVCCLHTNFVPLWEFISTFQVGMKLITFQFHIARYHVNRSERMTTGRYRFSDRFEISNRFEFISGLM